MNVIYTCIFGEGYYLWEPDKICDGWEYVCFTDQDIQSKHWNIINIDPGTENLRRASRKYKMGKKYLHVKYDKYIYIDAKFKPVNYLDKIVKKYLGKADIAFLKHNKRGCIYKEAKFLANNSIESWLHLSGQIEHYMDKGFPKNYGLLAPGIMLYRNNRLVDTFMEMWYTNYQSGSARDMISLMYTIWQCEQSIRINTMPLRKLYKAFRP